MSVDPFADSEKLYLVDSADEDGDSKSCGCVMQFSKLKRIHLRAVLAVGGLIESVAANFIELSASSACRAKFVKSSLANIRGCGLDGSVTLGMAQGCPRIQRLHKSPQ